MMDSYEVMWISDECPNDVDEGSATTTETSYTIQGLRGGSKYTITVISTVASSVGAAYSDSVVGETEELRECMDVLLLLEHYKLRIM